jgi:hypothetical protein
MNEQDGVGTAAGAPDGLPMLTVGRHRSPESGSCVMEFVSVLAGEPWSDSPGCTDRALGELARRVNDDVGREARPALATIAPRLVGALGPDVVVDLVIAAVVRVGLEHAPEDPALTRIQRRVHVRIAAAAGPGGPLRACVLRLARVATGAGLPDAYLHLGRAVSGRPRAERDAARVRALAAAVEDVRAHLGGRAQASSRPAPTSADVGWSRART